VPSGFKDTPEGLLSHGDHELLRLAFSFRTQKAKKIKKTLLSMKKKNHLSWLSAYHINIPLLNKTQEQSFFFYETQLGHVLSNILL
jgi:hypothetical protein